MSAARCSARLLAGTLVLASASARADMGNIATTYGLLPSDVASAQALSIFNPDISAVYYNPAYLVDDPHGSLTTGLLHADHSIRAKSEGGSNPMLRDGDNLPIDPSEQILLGMKTNLSSLTKASHPLYLGMILGMEKFGREMLGFNSGTSQQGQYLEYGRQPLFLAIGGGTSIWRGVDAGATLRVTLHAGADLKAQSDLAGNTQYEQLDVSAKPVLRPIVGLSIDWGRTLCPDDANCQLRHWQTAVSYKAYSNTQTRVDANAVIPGTVPPPGLTLSINTLDAFQPDIYSIGMLYKGENFRAGATAEWQRWSRLTDELRSDTVRDQGGLKFRDTLIPRIGADFRLNDRYSITTGLAFVPSPLESSQSLDVNYLDNDRIVFGLGAHAEYQDPWIFAFPLSIDAGYQLHWLRDRDFQLSSSQVNGGAPYESLRTSGMVNVLVGSLTLEF